MDLNPSSWTTLTASQARDLADRAHQPQKVCEEHFLNLIKLFIKQQASTGKYECDYNIPGFMLGLPLYDPYELARTLEGRLRREGWKVKRTLLRLTISWASQIKSVIKGLHR